VQIVNDSALNSGNNAAGDSAKIEIYKWDNTWGTVASRAANYSGLFFGQGLDLKASADAAVISEACS